MEKGSPLITLCTDIFFCFLAKIDVGPIFGIYLVVMLVIMHYALVIMLVLEHILNHPIFV